MYSGLKSQMPSAVLDFFAHACNRFRRGMLDILVHERDIGPIEQFIFYLGMVLGQYGSRRAGKLEVVAFRAQRSHDGKYFHISFFRASALRANRVCLSC